MISRSSSVMSRANVGRGAFSLNTKALMHGVYERLPNEAEIARPPLVVAERRLRPITIAAIASGWLDQGGVRSVCNGCATDVHPSKPGCSAGWSLRTAISHVRTLRC